MVKAGFDNTLLDAFGGDVWDITATEVYTDDIGFDMRSRVRILHFAHKVTTITHLSPKLLSKTTPLGGHASYNPRSHIYIYIYILLIWFSNVPLVRHMASHVCTTALTAI